MKWKTVRKEPKEGDIRVKTKFALFPIEVNNGYTVWLETYDSVQEYRYGPRANHHIGTVMRCDWDEIDRIPLFTAF